MAVCAIHIPAEVGVSQFGDHSSTLCALDETFHDEIWFVNILHGAGVLSDGSSYGSNAHRSTLELVDDGGENLIIDFIESIFINIEGSKGYLSDVGVDITIAPYLSKITDAAQQSVCNTRRTT